MSIVFDRAIEYYDQTRAMPPERHAAMIEALVRETRLTRTSNVLEIGVGTGRIAISVAARLDRLFGIDLSLEMMGVLRRKLADTKTRIEVAQADALRLPFPENIFDVAYAVHVYHLVKDWQNAILDARRVLRRGGYLVVSFHKRDPRSANLRIRQELHALAAADGLDLRRPGAQSEEEIQTEIESWDPTPRIVSYAMGRETESPAEILEELGRQIYSETWAIPPDRMAAYVPQLRAWAEATFGDLSQPVPAIHENRWLIAQKR